jgi:hypothetical protein
MTDKPLTIEYRFILPDKRETLFELNIDPLTMTIIGATGEQPLPAWTALQFRQCPNCELECTTTPYCPVAVNLAPLIRTCGALVSHDALEVIVTTPERTISATTTNQRAVSSLLGLIMATSACTRTEYLKPMARFHLPFASEDETVYRTGSMYLLAQYFRRQEGLDYSLDFQGLAEIYRNLQIVNRALAERVRAAISEDATVNAIVLLDLLSNAVAWSIEDNLKEFKILFSRYGIRAD